jgi:hypothetical protein
VWTFRSRSKRRSSQRDESVSNTQNIAEELAVFSRTSTSTVEGSKIGDARMMKTKNRILSSVKGRDSLAAVLDDHQLAALGDAFINFAYSLALSNKRGVPSGAKVKGSLLAEGLRRAGLRPYAQSRVDRHMLADAAEALIVYGWLRDCITLEESVTLLEKNEDLAEGLRELLEKIIHRIRLS